jgi:hypothetical protein
VANRSAVELIATIIPDPGDSVAPAGHTGAGGTYDRCVRSAPTCA